MNCTISSFGNCALATALVLVVSHVAAAQEFKFLEVTVHDENGKPLADVTIDIRMDAIEFPMSTDANGTIALNVAGGSNTVVLNVHKQGYESQRMRWQRGSEVPATHTFKLVPGKPTNGIVLDGDGSPIAGAEVFVAPPDESLTFLNGDNPLQSKQTPVVTDSEGKFTLPHQAAGTTIVCLSDRGYAQFAISEQKVDEQLKIALEPWAQITLMIHAQATLGEGTTVGLQFVSKMGLERDKVEWNYEGQIDEHNKFECLRVLPGRALAYRRVPLQLASGQGKVDTRSHGVMLDLKPGPKVAAIIGGGKQKATGKLLVPVDYSGKVNWPTGYVVLTENNPVDLLFRTAIFEYGKLLSQGNVMDPNERVPPSLQPNYLVRYLTTLKEDGDKAGSFTITGVPPGSYQLSASVTGQQASQRGVTDLLTLSDVPVTIIADKQDEPFKLGEHFLEHTDQFNSAQE